MSRIAGLLMVPFLQILALLKVAHLLKKQPQFPHLPPSQVHRLHAQTSRILPSVNPLFLLSHLPFRRVIHNLTSCSLPNMRVARRHPNRHLLKSFRLPPLLQRMCLHQKMTSSRSISTHRLLMPHLRQRDLYPKKTLNRISSHCSVRKLHHRLGPKPQPQPPNLNLSLFHRSVMRPLVPRLPRIGMLAIIGTILCHPCN